jgi:hypothetical protein
VSRRPWPLNSFHLASKLDHGCGDGLSAAAQAVQRLLDGRPVPEAQEIASKAEHLDLDDRDLHVDDAFQQHGQPSVIGKLRVVQVGQVEV